MGYELVPSGIQVVYEWVTSGLRVGYEWVTCGLLVGYKCVMTGLQVGYERFYFFLLCYFPRRPRDSVSPVSGIFCCVISLDSFSQFIAFGKYSSISWGGNQLYKVASKLNSSMNLKSVISA